MTKILVVDNNQLKECWGAHDLKRSLAQIDGATVYVRRASQEDLPKCPSSFDRIVISGSITRAHDRSDWVLRLEDFLRNAIEASVPILGVCFGHQVLARILGGDRVLRISPEPEFGWIEIEQLQDSALLRGIDYKFYSFESHRDEVFSLPPEVKIVAKSQNCAIQAFEHSVKPIYGIQFHPEKNLNEAIQTLGEFKKKKLLKSFSAEQSRKMYDPRVGQTLFKNFATQSGRK